MLAGSHNCLVFLVFDAGLLDNFVMQLMQQNLALK